MAMTDKQQALYDAVRAEPGKHPHEYADDLGISPGAASRLGRVLVEAGKLRTTGNRQSTRYLPRRTRAKAAKRTSRKSTTRRSGAKRSRAKRTTSEAAAVERALPLRSETEVVQAMLVGEDVLVVGETVYRARLERIA